MASCKECTNYKACGLEYEKGAQRCDAFKRKDDKDCNIEQYYENEATEAVASKELEIDDSQTNTAKEENKMARCKDCVHKVVCATFNDRLREELEKGEDCFCQCEDYTCERNMAKEIEETTLKIKASAYDVIKEAMLEQMKMDYDISDTFNIIDGVIRMEEAVTVAFVK